MLETKIRMAEMRTENELVVTKNACYDFEFNWLIPNFKIVPGGKLTSTLPTYGSCSLQLELVLKVSPGSTRKLKIGLSRKHYEPHNFYTFFYFEFCNNRGEIFFKDSMDILFSSNQEEIFSDVITKPTSATAGSNEARHQFVSVRGHVVVKPWFKRVETVAEPKDEAVTQLQNDFNVSLQSGEASDITLDTGNEQFRVHKFVLCSRSPVFRRMLENDMSERRQNIITFKDISGDVLKTFISFLYTGKIGRTTFDTTCELYSAGDKYEVFTLQKRCRDIIICNLSQSNVSGILKLANMHNDHELEDKAAKFICKNFKAVADNDKWKALIADSPFLVSCTLQKVSKHLSVL